jgi:hypothetical protein
MANPDAVIHEINEHLAQGKVGELIAYANPGGDRYPAVCDPESCDCEAVGFRREGVHIIFTTPKPHHDRVSVADCDAGIVADHLVHQPGRCRCRFDDATDRGRQR